MSDEAVNMPDQVAVPKKRKTFKKILKVLIFFLIIGLLGTSIYFYYQYQKLAGSPASAQVKEEEEIQRLIKAVGKLILLPRDETPTVATVTDIDKLKDQPFFKDAKNGDKVLIYPNLKQVIIYDPLQNLILNVGSVSFSEEKQ